MELPVSFACPICKTPLVKNESGFSCSHCSLTYPVRKGIPILLKSEARSNSKLTAQNSELTAEFDYLLHYKTDAEKFDYFAVHHGATEHSERRVREYTAKFMPQSAKTILDIGCGSAWVARTFLPQGKIVYSLDASEKNPSEALRRFPSEKHFGVAGDAFALPFANNSFDAVIAAEIIEHVVDPAAFVAEAVRIIKPGGRVIISTPYKEKLRYELCIHCQQMTPINAHLHSFDERVLQSLNKSTDFSWVAFNNKLLVFARMHPVLKLFPFGLWKLTDAAANAIVKKPMNIVVTYSK
ncbi:MAG TPA: methyltransferase domain-containing protein [Candidatus Kapabacteria bacterium]|nr:methyltransferase domain-containing protein [Candidatus Kapabacteria bacterium]